MKGDNQTNGLPPNTFRRLLQPANLLRSSFLRCSIPVQSVQIAFTWRQNIISENSENKRASKTRNNNMMKFPGCGLPILTNGHEVSNMVVIWMKREQIEDG